MCGSAVAHDEVQQRAMEWSGAGGDGADCFFMRSDGKGPAPGAGAIVHRAAEGGPCGAGLKRAGCQSVRRARIFCSVSGWSVVMKSTPMAMNSIMSASELTVQTFTFMPRSCASVTHWGLFFSTVIW